MTSKYVFKTIHNRSGVYALICPFDRETVMYVGRSVNISSRYNTHKSSRNKYPASRWVADLKEKGENPCITVLEYHDSPEKIEAKWIKYYKDRGQAKLNLHDGSEQPIFAGGGKQEEVWSVDGLANPFIVWIRSLFRFTNNKESYRKVVSHWQDLYSKTKTELDRVEFMKRCFVVVQRLGTMKNKIAVERWAMKAAPQINAKYPNNVTLVYSDGIEVTP